MENRNLQTKSPCKEKNNRKRFYFEKINAGTEQAGWEMSISGFVFRWMKFSNHKHFFFWRCTSFGKVAWFNRSIEFTLPRLQQS